MATSVGGMLKAERERQQRQLAQIAEELCITQRYLRAIEQDDLKGLPGTFFYKSFVKQYAATLHLDEKTLQSGVDALTAPLEPAPPAAAPTPMFSGGSEFTNQKPVRDLDPIVRDGNRRYFPDRRMGLSSAALVGVLLVCSGFYAWYSRVPQAAPVAKSAVETPQAAPAVTNEPVKLSTETTPNPAAPSIAVTTTTGPDGVNHVVLNLSATEKTWLSITSEGKNIFSGVLEPSQTKTLTAAEAASMKVGNAGGIEVRWNGKPIGPIGPRGQVRTVLFTPENFKILAPTI